MFAPPMDCMDRDLRRRLELFLQQKGVSSWRRLKIDVQGGQVRLQGTVRSYYERQLCLCCQHVAGVLGVVDQLQVERQTVGRVSAAG